VAIRGQPLRVIEALHRSLAHASYHVGQIVYQARGPQGGRLAVAQHPAGVSRTSTTLRPTWRRRRPTARACAGPDDACRSASTSAGTKIEAIALAAVERRRPPAAGLPPRATTTAPFDAHRPPGRRAGAETGRTGTVGIGIPGVVTRATGPGQERQLGLVSTAVLSRQTSRRGSDAAVRMANDANCFTLSEAIDGAGQGAGGPSSASYSAPVWAAGIAVGRRILDGPNQVGRGVGPQLAPLDGRPGSAATAPALLLCGKTGLRAETWLSGPGFERGRRPARGPGPGPHPRVVTAARGRRYPLRGPGAPPL
jgi:hypothetical protein